MALADIRGALLGSDKLLIAELVQQLGSVRSVLMSVAVHADVADNLDPTADIAGPENLEIIAAGVSRMREDLDVLRIEKIRNTGLRHIPGALPEYLR